MFKTTYTLPQKIYHHIGGLESSQLVGFFTSIIYHHIGGLEN
ncbi:hypothetical protein [uncultured Gammaproteobacteria bacterium]|nr:hypothetical protein [uncultured Gammaproteobacteria bacterium]CAC9587461.1 hypothetical protein [uncultured Gammaproteobacteria bacterium]CAC9966461.1 hypothetical protein [uncultured Gammaproteobacteria bacterium]